MTPQEKLAIAMDAYNKIFASKIQGVDITTIGVQTNTGIFSGRWFNNSVTAHKTLRGFDVMFNDGRGMAKVRFIEQNPDKPSEPGRRAASGSRIMWAIDQRTNDFLFSIENGEVVPGRKSAYTPVVKVAVPDAAPVIIPEEIHEFAGDPADEVLHYYESEQGGVPTNEEWAW